MMVHSIILDRQMALDTIIFQTLSSSNFRYKIEFLMVYWIPRILHYINSLDTEIKSLDGHMAQN